jgi:hypothetical protein
MRLKNKGIDVYEATDIDYEGRREELFEYTDVKNAVDWLKKKFKEEPIVLNEINDLVLLSRINKYIDEAFEDVIKK